MDLDTVADLLAAFYRLVGTEEGDPALIEQGEASNAVAYQALTKGIRSGQRFMLSKGYMGWRELSAALTWTPASVTGIYVAAVPSGFLRAFGNAKMSALIGSDGKRWGQEITAYDHSASGQCYWFEGEEIKIPATTTPPTLRLDYHYRHDALDGSATITFPQEARSLIVAYAANHAKQDNWLPGGPEMELKVREAVKVAEQNAIDVARPTKTPRQIRVRKAYGTHW